MSRVLALASKSLVVALALVVAGGAACGGSSPKAPAEPVSNVRSAPPPAAAPAMSEGDQVLAAMERFTGEMCACVPKDAECAKRVDDAMGKWSQDMQASRTDRSKPIEVDLESERAKEMLTKLGRCTVAARGQ
jgi:hypothetical protein